MEKTEKAILDLLAEDARFSHAKIAKMLGIEEKIVSETVKRLEENGTIVKYTAIMNDEVGEEDVVEAFIEVKVTPQKGTGFDKIAEEIANAKEVKSLYLMSGAYDLAVIVEGKSLRSISRFVSERISTYDCVLSTATHFILKKYKIEGVTTTRQADDMRLSVQA